MTIRFRLKWGGYLTTHQHFLCISAPLIGSRGQRTGLLVSDEARGRGDLRGGPLGPVGMNGRSHGNRGQGHRHFL